MKKLLHFFISAMAIAFFGTAAYAQAPNAIPYQGVARNAAGNILASQPIGLRISIHDATASGTVVFSETHATTTTALGLFSINIGNGTAVIGTLGGVNWGGGAKFIQVEMDAAGGTAYTDMGTTQLNSVPYALYAGSSANLPNGTATGNTMRWNGTAWVADNTLTNTGTNTGIGTASPNSSAILEASSTSKGFLMPCMTTVQRDAIASPAVGLQIFNLDDQCTDIYDGANWIKTCGLKVTGTNIIPVADSWTQKANFGGTARDFAACFSIGNKGYIGMGYDGSSKNDFWEYDTASNAWSQKANFAGVTNVFTRVYFSIENKGYAGGAAAGFWEYNPAGNAWTQKANLPSGNWDHGVSFSIGNKGYIGTGSPYPYNKEFWEYNPLSTVNGNDLNGNPKGAWTRKADFGGTARKGAVGFSIDGMGYIGTGVDVSNFLSDFWQYDPVSDTWTQKASVGGLPRYFAVGFSIANKGYIGTGDYATVPLNDFFEYNPATNQWTSKANFSGTARQNAVGFSIGNKGFIGTGGAGGGSSPAHFTTTKRNDFWEYRPSGSIMGSVYSSNSVSTSVNTVSDGAWTLANGTVYNSNTGNVGIGTTTPTAKLDIAGKIKIVDGTQAVNRVLTSDANGLASWATIGTVTSVAALTIGTTGTDINSTVANGTTTPVITLHVPDAGAAARGVVTTGAQTFAGTKTFTGGLTTTGTGAITSSGGGIGYATGAGGTVTQITSRSTAVTLNKLCGTITMFSAAQANQAVVSFTLNNSFIAATDFILVQHNSATNQGRWQFSVVPAAGSCIIYLRNVSTTSITEATPLRFTIIKAVNN